MPGVGAISGTAENNISAAAYAAAEILRKSAASSGFKNLTSIMVLLVEIYFHYIKGKKKVKIER